VFGINRLKAERRGEKGFADEPKQQILVQNRCFFENTLLDWEKVVLL
jgi:hypothetical protein